MIQCELRAVDSEYSVELIQHFEVASITRENVFEALKNASMQEWLNDVGEGIPPALELMYFSEQKTNHQHSIVIREQQLIAGKPYYTDIVGFVVVHD